MKKTFVLTSFVALTIATQATNAMADYTENSSYGETCSVGNIGAYDSSTSIATAHFAPDTYQCTAGQYLGADSTACGACPAGSFCSSADTYTFNASAAQGATACPTGYTNSDSGASANTQCYRVCSNSDVAHSTGTVNGGVYYDGTSGDGVNACVPTDCVSGWHLQQNGENLGTTLRLNENSAFGGRGAYIDATGTFGTMQYNSVSHDQTYYGITGNNTWVADYTNSSRGFLYGTARCSSVSGTWLEHNTTAELGAERGQYCYCNITGYKANDSAPLQRVSSDWWAFNPFDGGYNEHNINSASSCASNCAYACAERLSYAGSDTYAFRAALAQVSSVVESVSCEPNTITVRWGDKDGGVHESNTCTYGGTLYTPTTAPAAPKGHHFTGWTFDLGNN